MSNDLDSPYAVCNDARVKESWVPTALEFFFGIFGNVLAIILVWVNREKHKWIGFYRMFTALVITDFLGVFCTYPFAIRALILRTVLAPGSASLFPLLWLPLIWLLPC